MEDIKIITIEDDADDIIVDSPAEVYSSLSEAYASIRSNQDAIRDAYASIRSSQENMRAALDTIKTIRSAINAAYASISSNQETMRNAARSLSKGLQKFYQITKPVTPAINSEAMKSMTAGLSKFAEVTKTISSQYDFSGAAAALTKMSQAMAQSNVIAETIKNSSTLAMTEVVRKSTEASSRALAAHFAAKGLSVPAEQLRGFIASTSALPECIPAIPSTAMTSFASSISAVVPKTPSLFNSIRMGLSRFAGVSFKIAEWFKTSSFFEAARSALVNLRDYLSTNINPIFEKLRTYRTGLKKFALRALLYLRKRWLARRGKPYPLDGKSVERILVSQTLGPVAPVEYVEFADRFRQSYLRRHQRISEDTDDLNDSFLLAS